MKLFWTEYSETALIDGLNLYEVGCTAHRYHILRSDTYIERIRNDSRTRESINLSVFGKRCGVVKRSIKSDDGNPSKKPR